MTDKRRERRCCIAKTGVNTMCVGGGSAAEDEPEDACLLAGECRLGQ